MLELLYPAVLGSIIFSLLDQVMLPLVDLARNYLFRSSPISAAYDGTWFQTVVLLITIFFYCIDYLYVMFSKHYDRKFFVLDIAFLLGLYVTVDATGLMEKPHHSPDVTRILGTYCFFLILYFWWDYPESKRRGLSDDERAWYTRVLTWEIISLFSMFSLTLFSHWMKDTQCFNYLVVVVLGLVSLAFAIITWQKKRFHSEPDSALPVEGSQAREEADSNGTLDEITKENYLKDFVGVSEGIQQEALKQAHDIRKFEIDLYWKRAAYFWTFIAAALAGYFALNKVPDKNVDSTCLVACLGLLFSVAWYLVNRGSKAWQHNWELHVDLLEDGAMGPLYKSVLSRHSPRFWALTDSYPFSPSKINLVVGLFMILVWVFLIGLSLFAAWGESCRRFLECLAILGTTLAATFGLYFWGRTDESGVGLRIFRSKRSYR